MSKGNVLQRVRSLRAIGLRRAGRIANSSRLAKLCLVCFGVLIIGLFTGLALVKNPLHRESSFEWMKPVQTVELPNKHNTGGIARVAVATRPELEDRGQGGETLRQLVYPSLFDMQPDGTYRSLLVKAASDHTTRDARQARFRLRDDAKWSDGTLITIDDLRRTMDSRIVAKITLSDSGEIVVDFLHPFPTWRSLWSGPNAIVPPKPDLAGGPFFVKRMEPGRKTSLVPNPKWRDGKRTQGPFLDEIALYYVPDSVTARQLFEKGDIDVVVPYADTQRASLYRLQKRATVNVSEGVGPAVYLYVNESRVASVTRKALRDELQPLRFRASLLPDDTEPLASLNQSTKSWNIDQRIEARVAEKAADADIGSLNVTLYMPLEDPMSSILHRTIEHTAKLQKGVARMQSVDGAAISRGIRENAFDVTLLRVSSNRTVCYRCSFAGIDDEMAIRADGGSAEAIREFERKLVDNARVIPLWHEKTISVYNKDMISGVRANGSTASAAWGAVGWWKP